MQRQETSSATSVHGDRQAIDARLMELGAVHRFTEVHSCVGAVHHPTHIPYVQTGAEQ